MCDETLEEWREEFRPAPGKPWMAVPQRISTARRCGTEYHDGGGAATAVVSCSCGTFAIGHCQACNNPVCGSHSALHRGTRLCTQDYEKAVTSEQLEAERVAREAKEAEAERVRQLRTANNVPLPLTAAEAFDIRFLRQDATARESISARRVLSTLDVSAFTDLALSRLRETREPQMFDYYQGRRVGLYYHLVGKVKRTRVWWLDSTRGLSVSGRWVCNFPGEGWSSGRKGYMDLSADDLRRLVGY